MGNGITSLKEEDVLQKKVLINEMIVQKIVNLIQDEQLQTGDKLPSERALSGQLGVSRTSLREALYHLKAQGVVRIRQGSGIYVDDVDELTMDQLSTPPTQDVFDHLHHLLETRKMIEVFAIRQVIESATSEQIEQLRKTAIDEHNKVLYNEGCPEIAKSPHISFEGAIVNFLNNPIVSNTHKQLRISWKNHLDEMNAHVLQPDGRHEQHLEVVDALAERDIEKAELALLNHLGDVKEALCQLEKEYKAKEKVPS